MPNLVEVNYEQTGESKSTFIPLKTMIVKCQHLKLNIFRYDDMKIVIKNLE